MDKLELTPEQQLKTITLFVQFQCARRELMAAQDKFDQERERINKEADELGIPQLMKRSTWQEAITIDTIFPIWEDDGVLRHYNARTGEILNP